jgi:hypothetical protein
MTSAALADCQGAISDSASKASTKRTVFMGHSGLGRQLTISSPTGVQV